MFTPVTGKDLSNFDAETIKLYSKRASDPRLTKSLLQMDRSTDRNCMPVVANPLNQWQKDREAYNATIAYKTMALFAFFCFGCKQFSKAYFPYGIILRRSIPTTIQQ